MISVEGQQIQKLYGLIEASTLVISSFEINEVLELVMQIAKRVVEAQASSLLILDEETGLLGYEVALGEKGEEVKRKFSLKLGQGIAGWVAQNGKPLLVPDVDQDKRFFQEPDRMTGFKTRSILCVPMRVHDRMIGVLEVINSMRGQAFGEQDLELLSAFSSLAAIAIENAKLNSERLEQQALEQELAIARQIQDKFLKRNFPASEKIEGYAKIRSAHKIGGDFYDFINLGQDRWGILIGDVSGRGIPAALYMVEILTEFRLEASSGISITEIFERLNGRFFEKATLGMFATVCCVVIDFKTGKGQMVNAGHLPIYIGKRRNLRQLAGDRTPPLGILPSLDIRTQDFSLKKGERVFLMTDGVIEARNAKGQLYGSEKFEKYLVAFSSLRTLHEMVERFFLELDRFRGHFAISDDVTFVAVEYKGPNGSH